MQKPTASKQVIDNIIHLFSSGQLEQAELKCSSMLINHPQDVNLIGLHGALLLKMGRAEAAQQALQKAIALEPEFAKPHEDDKERPRTGGQLLFAGHQA